MSRARLLVLAAIGLAIAAFGVKAVVGRALRGYSNTRGARVVHYSLESRLLGRRLGEVAIVPPGGGRRPLLVLLHGRHDPPPYAWLLPVRSGPESMLNDALFAGLARLGGHAPVVVLLNGGGHSYFHDRRDGPWASMMLKEAIPDAVRRFGTLRNRIAIGGISMGGYGALHLAALRPREFCAVGGHSAAIWESGGSSAPGAFDDAEDYSRNDLFAAVREGAFDHLPVWIDGGTRDPFREATAAFVDQLLRHRDRVVYHVWPGAHQGSYWHAHMAAYLRFYASQLGRCRR